MKTVTFLEKINTSGQPIKIGKQLILNATKAQQKTEGTPFPLCDKKGVPFKKPVLT